MRSHLAIICAVLLVLGALLIWHFKSAQRVIEPAVSVTPPSPTAIVAGPASSSESAFTTVSAHTLLLRKGPDFRVYIPWLRGRMMRTHHDVNPSFDDPESFVLDIETGVIHANIGVLIFMPDLDTLPRTKPNQSISSGVAQESQHASSLLISFLNSKHSLAPQ